MPIEKLEIDADEKAPKVEKAEALKWIVDTVQFTKTCAKCGATMRGWAYREKFDYCPKCGTKMA